MVLLCSAGWSGTCYKKQAGLKVATVLLPPCFPRAVTAGMRHLLRLFHTHVKKQKHEFESAHGSGWQVSRYKIPQKIVVLPGQRDEFQDWRDGSAVYRFCRGSGFSSLWE